MYLTLPPPVSEREISHNLLHGLDMRGKTTLWLRTFSPEQYEGLFVERYNTYVLPSGTISEGSPPFRMTVSSAMFPPHGQIWTALDDKVQVLLHHP